VPAKVASTPRAQGGPDRTVTAYVTPFDKVFRLTLVHGRIGDGRNVPTG
jgi:hypothetical protein